MMSDSCRTVADARAALQSSKSSDSRRMVTFYNSWAENYDEDLSLMGYRAPHLVVDFLSEKFSGCRQEAQVLDVACGTGWIAKLMVEVGFRHFVGVDGSQGMLDRAAKTGLYQDLRLALLGTQALPAERDMFDLVIIAGALDVGFIPVSVVRELCAATRQGGLVCMARGGHRGAAGDTYKKELERELQLMEGEGLWTLVGLKQAHRYMENPHLSAETAADLQDERFISGTLYLYQKQ